VTQPAEPAREAAERTASAVAQGNLAQVLAVLTPEALSQMMELGAQQGGGINPTALPGITAYSVTGKGTRGDAEVFEVTFTSETASATIETAWKPILGQWKIVAITVLGTGATPPA
jgi:hypothetical protein